MIRSIQKPATSSPRKILVIGLSNIGDTVLSSPVISVLKRLYPQALMTALVGPRAAGVLEGSGMTVLAYDKRISWRARWNWVRRLNAEHFDWVVDLRSSWLGWCVRARRTFRKPMLKNSRQHVVLQHLAALRALGPTVLETPEFCVPVSSAAIRSIDEKVRPWAGHRTLVGLATGGFSDLKRWSEAKFIELGRRFEQTGAAVVWIGDRRDRARMVEAGLPQELPGFYSGQLNWQESLALLARCRLVISNDSALLHASVAAGAPTLGLFGPGDDRQFGPLARPPGLDPPQVSGGAGGRAGGVVHRVVRRHLPCSPCGLAQCPLPQRYCLDWITVEEVFDEAMRMLKA